MHTHIKDENAQAYITINHFYIFSDNAFTVDSCKLTYVKRILFKVVVYNNITQIKFPIIILLRNYPAEFLSSANKRIVLSISLCLGQ